MIFFVYAAAAIAATLPRRHADYAYADFATLRC